MIQVLSGVWALLLGIVLIMLGNGMHFTLIGLRGGNRGVLVGRTGRGRLGLFPRLPVGRAP